METPLFVSLITIFYPAFVSEDPGQLTLQSIVSRRWVGVCKLKESGTQKWAYRLTGN